MQPVMSGWKPSGGLGRPGTAKLNHVRPQWADSAKCKECYQCGYKFPEGLMGRFNQMKLSSQKHHCRHCGQVFCSNCSQKRVAIPHLNFYDQGRVL